MCNVLKSPAITYHTTPTKPLSEVRPSDVPRGLSPEDVAIKESKMKLTEDDLFYIMDESFVVNNGRWKYGSTETHVFQKDDKFWSVTIQFHPEDGIQMPSVIEAVQVQPVQITKTGWQRVSDGKVIGISDSNEPPKM